MSCPKIPLNPTIILKEHCEKGCTHWFDNESKLGQYSSQKARPYIIISRTSYSSDKVQICPLTDLSHKVEKLTGQMKYPYHGVLYIKDNIFLEKDSAILSDQITTIGKDELFEEWYMGKIDNCKTMDMALLYQFNLFDTVKETIKSEMSRFVNQIDIAYTDTFSRK